ncbi:uncharacterized protein LOC129893375 isoform X2 [Solanum dulcamara]|uniref:uncharacterized protein LOC129893375 isoform X2 n=1 Tax=Solanum dulcamara TaxID=45834 RepID=UPI0024858C35|nr:uncharacterized protein LOC129893375 isoform X2 [Solanum dulcamara]
MSDMIVDTLSAVSYAAISKTLPTSPLVVAAGLAVDNLICAVYFTTLFASTSKIPVEATQSPTVATTIRTVLLFGSFRCDYLVKMAGR